jgi:glycolate oxidase FAD binding subunit
LTTAASVAPASADEAAALLRETAEAGRRARIRGGGTKLGWGRPTPPPDVELSTARLDAIVEHNEGDLTAIVQAGVPLARAQETFAAAGQMLAIDPPHDEAATIGGVVATGDAGPLRHRYHGVRDLVLGVQVALPDGSVARAGSKVIKNVAGYDLAKLMTGSFGTLGLVVELSLRLHPLPRGSVTAVARGADPAALAAAASELAHRPLEPDALDLAWDGGEGAVLARFSGASAPDRARDALAAIALDGEVVDDDAELWERQREGQRSAGGAVVRVSTRQTRLADALRAAPRAVARAGAGLVWLTLADASPDAVRELRARLAPSPCVLLDAPEALRAEVDPWGEAGAAELELMRRVKERFDPTGACNPGLYVGGL